MKKTLVVSLCLVAGSALAADLQTYYNLDGTLNPFINNTGLAQPLLFRTGGAGGSSSAGTPSYTNETVGSTNKLVANFAAPQFFRAIHGVGKNGGGSYLNQYAILLDLKITNPGGWVSFYSTAAENGNDGDAFIRDSDSALGIIGDYGGTFVRNQWNRVIISVDTVVPTMRIYLNGSFVNDIALDSGVDGRWSVYTLDDGDAGADWVDIFGDDDGDNGTGQLSALAFFSGAVNDSQAAALGGPGQPVPEPATLLALGLGALALARRRRR
jgi:hypothetical protein